MNLSVIIISYQSNHLLKKILINFPKKYQIIIVDNSRLKTTKGLEKKFKNTEVVLPSNNLGYAKAFNLALKKCKNNFVLTLTPDVLINKNLITQLEKFLKKFKTFTLIAPEFKNQKIYKNYVPFDRNDSVKLNYNKFNLKKVKEIDWCFCIINKKKLKKPKILDENFFMYFETTDLCKRLSQLNHKMLIIENLKFDHIGTGSTKKKYNNEILINRNWHYTWSKFYFFRKHNSYLYALKKILPNIYQNFIGMFLSSIMLNFFDFQRHKASLAGALSAIFLKKSYYRPELKENEKK